MSNRAELVVDKAINAIDEVLLSRFGASGTVTTEILGALCKAGLVLVDRSDPPRGVVMEEVEPMRKCPVCGGLGVSATVEQFENAYKRH